MKICRFFKTKIYLVSKAQVKSWKVLNKYSQNEKQVYNILKLTGENKNK